MTTTNQLQSLILHNSGDERRDNSTTKKDGIDESTAKPNSPGPGDERRDDSTAKKDDDEDTTTKTNDSTLPVMKA